MGGRDATMVLLDENGIRCDGRKIDEPRRIMIKAGGLKNADGSAYIEFGDNKILVGVFGPRDVHPKHMSNTDTGILRVRYHMEPFSVGERKRPAPSRREIEISKVIKEALEPAVMLEKFPRTAVDVFIEVLQADGGTRCAALTAASVALADAGIPMRDMVAAIASGKVADTIILDVNNEEDQAGQADMPVGYMPSLKKITLLQLDGVLTPEEYKKCVDVGVKGCEIVYELQKKAQILELLEQGKRVDGRALDEPRKICIEINAIPKANGSARVYLGDTQVLCGVKIQPDKPFPDVGDKGMFMCTAELLPLSHPTVETGPPQAPVIELARVVDRGIRESHMVDVSQLVIEKDKSVVGVFADVVVIDYDGNLFDACSYAATAALLTSKTPTWEMVDDQPTVVEGGDKQLPVSTIPVSVTMGKIGNYIVVDPNGDEWASMDSRITITTDSDGNIVALQKGGSDGFSQEEINQCGELSVKVGAKIREQLKSAQEESQ